MTDKEIIQALKDNDVAFGLMPSEMQVIAKEIGQSEFSMYMKDNTWMRCGHVNNFYDSIVTDQTYRLSPEYEAPEPEVVECEVFEQGDQLYYDYGKTGTLKVFCATANPDFIGFLAEGWLTGRQYKNKATGGIEESILLCDLNDYEVLIPTHCLFRSKK